MNFLLSVGFDKKVPWEMRKMFDDTKYIVEKFPLYSSLKARDNVVTEIYNKIMSRIGPAPKLWKVWINLDPWTNFQLQKKLDPSLCVFPLRKRDNTFFRWISGNDFPKLFRR